MRIFWDERRVERVEMKVDRLEEKMDGGFVSLRGEIVGARNESRVDIAGARSESRVDFRMLLGVLLAMFMAMILGFAGILGAILIQHA